MENIVKLHQSIIKLEGHVTDRGEKYRQELMDNFNLHMKWLKTIFNPTDEWLKNEDFRTIFNNWVRAVSPDNKFNEGRKMASLASLKEVSGNDIEVASKVLINAAIYGTLNFKESAKHIKTTENTSSRPTQVKAKKHIDRIEIEKEFKIKVLEHTLTVLKVKGSLSPVQYAKLEKLTGLKIIVG